MKKLGLAVAAGAATLIPFVSFAADPTSGAVSAQIEVYMGYYWDFVLAILGTLVLFAVTNAVLFLSIYFVLRRLHLIH